jgi:hypothetical protein
MYILRFAAYVDSAMECYMYGLAVPGIWYSILRKDIRKVHANLHARSAGGHGRGGGSGTKIQGHFCPV